MSVHSDLYGNQRSNESMKEFMIRIVQEQKPKTATQLLQIIHQTTGLSEKEIMNLLSQLETEDKIHFNSERELRLSNHLHSQLFRRDIRALLTRIHLHKTAFPNKTTDQNLFKKPRNY
jgi:hypothetical protein